MHAALRVKSTSQRQRLVKRQQVRVLQKSDMPLNVSDHARVTMIVSGKAPLRICRTHAACLTDNAHMLEIKRPQSIL